VFGEGIQNYMNDSPVDIGIVNNFDDPVTPILGQAIPIQGIVAFVDHTWNSAFTSTFGYSWQENDNTEAQAPSAFRTGHYLLANILHYPAPNFMVGGEFQWGRRENFADGFTSDGIKIQVSFKYNFSVKLGG
jgi:nucleoside-specific outer membrane channel protein Tsx